MIQPETKAFKLFEYNGCIITQSGRSVDLNNPTPDVIDINDIAHALSQLCHWNGHSKSFFSVAQHSVFVSSLCPPYLQAVAFIHDFAEAYLGDITKPLKVIIGDVYTELERRFNEVIFAKFHLDINQLPLIKEYDLKVQRAEYDYFFGGNPAPLIGMSVRVNRDMATCLNPMSAKILFSNWYKTLFK